MNFFYFVVLAMTVVFSAKTEEPRTPPATRPNDQLVLTEQFIRGFFPQLAARQASVELRASIGVGVEPRPSEVRFEVIDWCVPPRTPGVPQVGHTVLPCTEYDKTYRLPLRGAIGFTNRNGRVVPVEGRFEGELFDAPGPCPQGKPVYREDFIERIHLDFLSAFLGKRARVVEIVQEPDMQDWTVRIQAGPRGSLHSFYDFHIGYCGYITSFYLKN